MAVDLSYEAYLAKKKKPTSLVFSSTAKAPTFTTPIQTSSYKATSMVSPVSQSQPNKKDLSYESYLATKSSIKPNMLSAPTAVAPDFSKVKPKQLVTPPELVKEVTKPLETSVLNKYIPELKKVAKGVGTALDFATKPATAILSVDRVQKGIQDILQSQLRSYQAFGMKVLGEDSYTPQGTFAKKLYGTDKPFTLGEQQPFVKPDSKLAIPIAAAFVLSDAIPGSRALKQTMATKGVKAVLHADDIKYVDDVLDAVKLKKVVSEGDFRIFKGIFESKGLELPSSKAKTIDFVKTIWKASDEIAEQAEFAKLTAKVSGKAKEARFIPPTPKTTLPPPKSLIQVLRDEITGQFQGTKRVLQDMQDAYKKSPFSDQRGMVKNPFSQADDSFEGLKFTPPKVGSVEDLLEKATGWRPGSRVVFDRALRDKNADVVRKMLPIVPEQYKAAFAKNIDEILKVRGEGKALSSQTLPTAVRPDVSYAKGLGNDIPPVPRAIQTTMGTPPGKLPPVKPIGDTVQKPSFAKSIGQTFSKVKTNVLEYVQNTEERIRQLQKRPDLKIDDTTDVYQKMTLMPGRLAAKVEQGYSKAQDIADDIVRLSGRSKTAISGVRSEVNKYLQALHAPERNIALGEGAAGIKTEEALKITKAAREEIKQIATKALDLNKETLKMLKESGVISDELFQTLTTKYKNHVPLQRVLDEAEDIGEVLSGKGFDVRSSGIKAAKGSTLEVKDILENIMVNYEQAAIRAEKNIVDNATLAFVKQNKDVLGDLFEIRSPKFLGTTKEGKAITQRSLDPQVLSFFENGKAKEIFIKDPSLAIALRGVGREKLPVLLRAVQSITRMYSSLATRFNPEFFLPNKIRDLQETVTFLSSQKDMGFRGAAKTLTKDPASIKAITDWMRGADTPGAKLYQEMISAGGTTGGMGLSTRKQVELNIDKLFDIARSSPKQVAQKLIGYVDNMNAIFEDSTRLSVYESALSRGLSKERAAFLAKEASINFNRMGKGGPLINALYMFSNASIQGSTKMMRAMLNPKTAAAVTTIVGGSVAAVNEWNDSVDPEWRDKVTKWDRMNGLTVMLPSEEGAKYFTIPVGWGLKPIVVMANGAHDAVSGQEFSAKKLTQDVLSSFLNAYNPVGGTDVTSAAVPTVLDLPVDIGRNLTWSGSKIRPDPDPFNPKPKDIQYFESLEDTAQGKALIEGTKKLRETTGIALSPADINYAVDQLVGGAGRSVRKTFNTVLGFFNDEPLPLDEYPLVSRFYRERGEDELGKGTGKANDLKTRIEEQSREDFYRRKEAESTFESFKEMPEEEANAKFKILKETNPLLAKKVRDIAKDEELGLTYDERLIKDLGVANGKRAEFILEELNKLATKEEKNAKVKEWREKKIISDEVLKQLKELLKKQ